MSTATPAASLSPQGTFDQKLVERRQREQSTVLNPLTANVRQGSAVSYRGPHAAEAAAAAAASPPAGSSARSPIRGGLAAKPAYVPFDAR